MLSTYSSAWDFREFLYSNKVNLDPALFFEILAPLYSHTGRPAIDSFILIRSFILMQHLKYVSVKRWCEDFRNDTLLQYLIGSFNPPSFSSHHDFIIRLTGCDPHLSDLYDKDHHKKLKKGEKLVNFTSEDTFSLCEKYKNDADFDRQRMMFTLQSLFNALVVIPSFDKGLIDSNNLTLSADGSSHHIHASAFGHKVEASDIEGDKTHRFSAPKADIGWDSDLESFYLGFTFYNIAYHSSVHNCDLPVFISIEKASRHDALSCISSTAQFLGLNPDIRPKYFCHDSVADSTAIYQYFHRNKYHTSDRS